MRKVKLMEKIKFQTGASSLFFKSLDKEVDEMIEKKDLLNKAKKLLYIKTIFYVLLFAEIGRAHV